MSINWNRFGQIVRESRDVVLTSHVRPDCDALGSELGMAAILESLGKRVRIVNADRTPPNLAFIDPERRILHFPDDISLEDLASADLLMILDTSAWVQLGAVGDLVRQTRAKVMVLDHHVSEDALGAEPFKDVSAEATGRLVVDAADHLGVALSRQMAIPLYAALATDTGWFRFPSTTPNTYRVAARLVEAGAEPSAIYRSLYEQETVERLRLRGRILSRLQPELDGRLIHTYVARSDFPETGAQLPDTEDAINLALSVARSEVAVIVVEQPKGGCKISFRSRSAVDCSELAGAFGGGGHRAAAGAFLEVPLEAARAQVLERVRSAMGSPG